MYNEAAKLNGFVDASMMKVDPYESKTFIQEMENTWQVGKDDKRQETKENRQKTALERKEASNVRTDRNMIFHSL